MVADCGLTGVIVKKRRLLICKFTSAPGAASVTRCQYLNNLNKLHFHPVTGKILELNCGVFTYRLKLIVIIIQIIFNLYKKKTKIELYDFVQSQDELEHLHSTQVIKGQFSANTRVRAKFSSINITIFQTT